VRAGFAARSHFGCFDFINFQEIILMSNTAYQKNIGAYIATVTSVRPQSASAGVINGVSIDRGLHSMALCCVLHVAVGALTGAPTTTSVIGKIQDSADNTNFSDYLPDGANVAAAPAVIAANGEVSLSVDLTLARRFIRAVATTAFTGGASPSVIAVADVILSGENTLAAV
jgi:hypothetical protein